MGSCSGAVLAHVERTKWRRVQMALPGMVQFGACARDVYPVAAHRPHGARGERMALPAAVPVPADATLPGVWPVGAERAWAPELEDDPRQLWLFGHRLMCRHVDPETGEVYYPDLPTDYPERRPRTFGYCQSLGLGARLPCAFATCRHSLLSDELAGETHPDQSPWELETCSLALVAGRRRMDCREIVGLGIWVEPTVEEWQRRGQVAFMRGLDCGEHVKLNRHGLARLKRPRMRADDLKTETIDGLAKLVAALPEKPEINAPPVKRFTAAEAAALYVGKVAVSPEYGTARPARSANPGRR